MSKEVFNLVNRLNEINKEINDLQIEYNQIVKELWDKIPSLKEDINIQKVKVKGAETWKN